MSLEDTLTPPRGVDIHTSIQPLFVWNWSDMWVGLRVRCRLTEVGRAWTWEFGLLPFLHFVLVFGTLQFRCEACGNLTDPPQEGWSLVNSNGDMQCHRCASTGF